MTAITTLSPGVARIDLVPRGLPGFGRFITSYLYRDKETFLIDIGPASTAPDLLLALNELNVKRVDYILLTHIHLDHAGAAGQISAAFPKAKIVCHPRGLKHLHQPQKLWQGSLGVLKNFALAYHEPQPVPLERLVSAEDFSHLKVKVVNAPGHAPHHLNFLFNDYFFIGESAGIFFNLGANDYLRPATPPRFEMGQALETLNVLEKLQPGRTAFAHYGLSPNGLKQVKAAQSQLKLWADTARRVVLNEGRPMQDCIEELLEKDPNVRHFNKFTPAEQKRELDFFANALLGILGYLNFKKV